MGPRQKLQREERRAPARGTVVVETAAEHLGLLGEAKLADGAKGDRALAEVPAVNCLVDLFVDVSAEVCERALVGNGRGALDSRCENRRQLADRGDRALPGSDVLGRGPDQPPGALLLEYVRGPAGDPGAGEHGWRQVGRNLG
jgi:hypothetical protein